MELVSELEPTPRGVYCGAIGVVAPPSASVRARFSVAIRTAVVDQAGGLAEYGVGGGITWSSDAGRERAELYAKAAVLTHDVSEHQLLQTMAYRPGAGLRNRDRHLARLADSADYFGFSLEMDHVLERLAAGLQDQGRPARVRLLLGRDGQVTVQVSELDRVPPVVRLAVDDDPVDARSPWLQHKTTQRSVYRDRAARHPDVDDVVLVNGHGEVTETTVASIAARLQGRWWTPPTTSGCLPGVERGRLVEQGLLGERVLRVQDLHEAERLAVLSSLRGWRQARLAVEPCPEP
jgi:para-aminobenzoate synthetase/4-amino-4-deoxychorismate lyase